MHVASCLENGGQQLARPDSRLCAYVCMTLAKRCGVWGEREGGERGVGRVQETGGSGVCGGKRCTRDSLSQ